MLRSILRPLAAVLLVPVALQSVGCVVHNPPRPVPKSDVRNPSDEEIHGVTTVEGHVVMFDMPESDSRGGRSTGRAPWIRADTLHGVVLGEPYRIPVSQVQRYWLRSVSTGKTVGLTAAVVGGAILAIALIAASNEPEPQPTTQSCPFVYSWDGERWVFDGEPYGGATTRGLERDDWAELEHLVAVDGEYRLRVTNEVPEDQYTDLLELIVVDHAPGTRVVSDGAGGFHQVRAPIPPAAATDETGRDLATWLTAEDRRVWEPGPGAERSEIVLEFPKPRGADRATLVHRVGTGMWGSYMIKSMLALHGRELDAWYAAVDRDPATRGALHAWNAREELYVLGVEVERASGWEPAGRLHGGGPFILESRALPIDLEPGSDRLRIRIRPPKGFWALDAFGVQYGPPAEPAAVRRVPAARAEDHLGRDVTAPLAAADGEYWEMPTNDDRAEIVFPVPPRASGTARTVFLHARGWYRIHLDDTKAPDREALGRIATVPGAAAQYAAEAYDAWRGASR